MQHVGSSIVALDSQQRYMGLAATYCMHLRSLTGTEPVSLCRKMDS